MFKSGFVSIIGKPNSGKSTLLNSLIEKKISIVTRRKNTTRNQIKGIYNKPDLQIVFVDTPGFLKVNSKLDEKMKNSIVNSMDQVDVILYLLPFWDKLDDSYLKQISFFNQTQTKKFLLLNQIDRSKNNDEILEKIKEVDDVKIFDEIIPISGLKKTNLETLLNLIIPNLKDNVPFYSENDITEMNYPWWFSEIIREKVLVNFNEEVPHNVYVKTTKIEKKKDLLKIFSEIIISRDSLKKIILGNNGQKIKQIGTQARIEIEKITNKKVFLDLQVKVKKDWMNNESFLKNN